MGSKTRVFIKKRVIGREMEGCRIDERILKENCGVWSSCGSLFRQTFNR